MTDLERFHPACLRGGELPTAPGRALFKLRKGIAVRGPAKDELSILTEGELMFAEASSRSVHEVLARHLRGPVTGSVLRKGVCRLIGVEAATCGNVEEAAIDRWIDESMVVFVQPNFSEPIPLSWFNAQSRDSGGQEW